MAYPIRSMKQPSRDPYGEIETGDTIFERVGIALYNALRLDPEASVRGLLAPDTLPPKKRKTLSTQFKSGRNGFERFLLAELTNPLVLVGAAMSFRWPILDPTKYKSAMNTLKQYERWIPPGFRSMLGLNEMFAGTPIPAIAAKLPATADNFAHTHFDKVGNAILQWRKAMGRTETVADQVRWGVLADGTTSKKGIDLINRQIKIYNRSKYATEKLGLLKASDFNVKAMPADKIIVNAARDAFEGVRTELSANPIQAKKMMDFASREYGMSLGVKWIEGYAFPRIATKNYRSVADLRRRVVEGLSANADVYGTSVFEKVQRYGKATAKMGAGSLVRRTDTLIPDVSDLELLKGSMSDRAKNALAALRERNFMLGRPPSYSLKFTPSVASYSHTVGRSYAWTFKGLGDELLAEADKVLTAEKKLGLGINKYELLKNVYIPALKGTATFDQVTKAMEWSAVRQAAWAKLNDPIAMKGVPEFAKKSLRSLLQEDSFWTPASAGNRITSYFYSSTLGLNLYSATQNLLQPILTTSPLIGFNATMRGVANTVQKIPAYLKLRRQGLSEGDALKRLFPEFHASGGEIGAMTTDTALKESLDVAKGGLLGLRTSGAKLRSVLLAPFRSTELFNRISTFEGARMKGLELGMSVKEALNYATETVGLTQLWAGGASTPSFMANWWGPFRQYLTFTSKLAAYGLGSFVPTLTSAGWQAGIGGPFNPGTLGRAMATSATAYEVSKEMFDADISRSLLFGGMPVPQEQAVLSPLPVIPPFVGIVAGGIQDLFTGSTENLQRSIPTMIPAGVQMARLSQTYAPNVAKLLGRGYVDSTKTLPDGRIPYYDNRGNLVGYKTSFELFLSNIGIPGKLIGPNGETKVQDLERYFLNQRDTMRTMRQGFIESTMEGNIVDAEKIQRKYMEDYGSAIEVRPQDWEASAMNRFIPRLERIAKSLPPDVRSRFLNIASTALSGQQQKFLGVDPIIFGVPRRQIAEHMQRTQMIPQQYE